SLISSEVIRNPDITKNTSTPRPSRSPVPFRYASCDTQKPLVPHRWPYKTSSIETARRPSSEGILLALSSDMTTFPPGTANSRSRSTEPFAILITAAACGGEKRDTVPAPGVHSAIELRHDLFPFRRQIAPNRRLHSMAKPKVLILDGQSAAATECLLALTPGCEVHLSTPGGYCGFSLQGLTRVLTQPEPSAALRN